MKLDNLRTFTIQSEQVENLKSERSIVHYITTNDKDWGGDIVNPKGMDDSNYANSPTVFYNHNYNLPLAKSLWRKPNEKGVIAKTQFSKKTIFADDIYQLHLEGVLNTWSIGWIPALVDGELKEGALVFDEEKSILYINEWSLVEYSSAPLAMNPNALDVAKSFAKSAQLKEEILYLDLIKNFDNEKEQLRDIINKQNDVIKKNEANLLEASNKIIIIEKDLQTVLEILNEKYFSKIRRDTIADEKRFAQTGRELAKKVLANVKI